MLLVFSVNEFTTDFLLALREWFLSANPDTEYALSIWGVMPFDWERLRSSTS